MRYSEEVGGVADLMHCFDLLIAQSPAPVLGQMLLEIDAGGGHGQVSMALPTRTVISTDYCLRGLRIMG